MTDLGEHSIVIVACGAFPLRALAGVRVHRGPPGDGRGSRRMLRRVLWRVLRVVVRRGADGGEVTVVVGHGHVMHVAAVAVVIAARGETLRVRHF